MEQPVIKYIFLVGAIVAVSTGAFFRDDTLCIIGAIFTSTYAIMDIINKKLKK